MTTTLNRPPSEVALANEEAEASVLGAVLLSPIDGATEAVDLLRPADFYWPAALTRLAYERFDAVGTRSRRRMRNTTTTRSSSPGARRRLETVIGSIGSFVVVQTHDRLEDGFVSRRCDVSSFGQPRQFEVWLRKQTSSALIRRAAATGSRSMRAESSRLAPPSLGRAGPPGWRGTHRGAAPHPRRDTSSERLEERRTTPTSEYQTEVEADPKPTQECQKARYQRAFGRERVWRLCVLCGHHNIPARSREAFRAPRIRLVIEVSDG